MKLQKNQLLELKIEKLAYGDKGIAYLPTEKGLFKIFVGGTFPGDKVSATVIKIKSNYAEARLEKQIEPSPIKIPPLCEHFGVCGGCNWQNIPYENQLEQKQAQVEECLKHIGGFDPVCVKKIIPAAEPYFYRNKLEFSFGDNADEPFTLGFHPRGRRHDVFKLNSCFLQAPETALIVKAVFDFFQTRNIPRFRAKDQSGSLKNLIVKHSKTEDDFLLNLVINEEEKEIVWLADFLTLVDSLPKVESVYLTKVKHQRGRKTLKNIVKILGKEALLETLTIEGRKINFRIDPDAFFQPNSRQAEVLYAEVLRAAKNKNEKEKTAVAFDLYCGTGTITIALSSLYERVFGFEINAAALADAKRNAQENDCPNAEFILGDVGETLSTFPFQPDLITVDPPRAGMTPKAISTLIALRPQKIVYISCNPATMSRDCRLLAAGNFYLESVQPVDMFPQTYHVEQVAELRRRD